MKFHVLHGIHTPTNDPVVESLLPFLKGEINYPDYGFILAVETRRINPVIVGSVAPYVGPDDIMVGHSNGCAIIYDLLQRGVKMKGVVLINGALRQDIILPPCVKFAHIYYNAGDNITEVARCAEMLAISPVDAVWGEMGHAGYVGNDPRVKSFDCGPAAVAGTVLPGISGHSDIFTPPHIAEWGPFINAQIEADA